MKKYQFEEMIACLSIIITLLAYDFGVMWLFWIFLVKSVFDICCALMSGYKSAMKKIKKDRDKV